MKYTLLFVIFLFSIINPVKSQDFDMITARDAYRELLKEIPDLDENNRIIRISGLKIPEVMLDLDFETGKANTWTFTLKSNENNSSTIYEYYIYSFAGEYNFDIDQYESDSLNNLPALGNDWQNSDLFATKIKENIELTEFYQNNKDNLLEIGFELSYNEEFETDTWMAAIASLDLDYYLCYYKSSSLEILKCDNPTSVESININSYNVYPNPTTDFITIQLSNNAIQPFASSDDVQIFNSLGKEIKDFTPALSINVEGVRIDVSHLPVGVYFVKIGGAVEKFVKMQ